MRPDRDPNACRTVSESHNDATQRTLSEAGAPRPGSLLPAHEAQERESAISSLARKFARALTFEARRSRRAARARLRDLVIEDEERERRRQLYDPLYDPLLRCRVCLRPARASRWERHGVREGCPYCACRYSEVAR